MAQETKRLGGPEWLILIGAGFFIMVLAVSAWWEPDIRWLHFFQARPARGCLRLDDWFLCPGYGLVPAAISWPVPPASAFTLAVRGI